MNRYLIIIIGFLLYSCNPGPKNEKLSEKKGADTLPKPKTEFLEYVSLIKQVELPLSFECEVGFPSVKVDDDHPLVKKFKPASATVIHGLLYQSETEVGIIYGHASDIVFPVLTKYDINGNEIENIKFFKLRECVGDAGYEPYTTGTISKDLQLATTFTSITWDYENENSKKDTLVVRKQVELR